MLLDISEVVSQAGVKKEFPVSLEAAVLTVGRTAHPIEEKEPFTLRIENIEERELLIRGRTALTVKLSCDRCLADVEKTFPVEIEKAFSIEEKKLFIDPEEDEGLFPEEQKLDVDRIVLSELLPDFPTKILCKEDCKGLCPVCGQDLNLRDCGCDRFVPDPRFAMLSDFVIKE